MGQGKKRMVILFGAGSILPWGGPQTKELTKLILESGSSFVCNDGQTKIVSHIYNNLICNGYEVGEINFETIVNVVEESITHYAYFNEKSKLPSISRSIFSSSLEGSLLNFSIAGGQERHGYHLEIPIDPQGVIVTLKDNNGNVIVQEKQLTLYKFGDSFLSQPLTMKVSGGQYHLSEFFVTGANGSVDIV